jgi:hypothetical protein
MRTFPPCAVLEAILLPLTDIFPTSLNIPYPLFLNRGNVSSWEQALSFTGITFPVYRGIWRHSYSKPYI